MNDVDQNNVENVFALEVTSGVYSVLGTVSDGEFQVTTEWTVNVDYTNNEITPMQTTLFGNYPNPFNPETKISLYIEEGDIGDLQIFNAKGQIFMERSFSSGKHNFLWNAENMSSGVYLYKLKTKNYEQIKRMMLMK